MLDFMRIDSKIVDMISVDRMKYLRIVKILRHDPRIEGADSRSA
jgi:hypothetical protein